MPRPHHSNPPSCVRSRSMPIFTYFAVVGSVMIALLFVAGATLEKGSPAVVTAQYGLPKPWHPVDTDQYNLPRPWRPDPKQILSSAPAPAPDMTSPLVLAAQPKVHAAPEVLEGAIVCFADLTRRFRQLPSAPPDIAIISE
jgi:hypothetical protein